MSGVPVDLAGLVHPLCMWDVAVQEVVLAGVQDWGGGEVVVTFLGVGVAVAEGVAMEEGKADQMELVEMTEMVMEIQMLKEMTELAEVTTGDQAAVYQICKIF